MGTEGLITRLESLGLAHNEALAYLTLLEDEGGSGLTGYEVAARSNVPRSAVYGVLRKLEGAGAAFSTGTDPVRFVPTDPARWVERQRREAATRLDEVQAALSALPKRSRPEPIWILQRYPEVMERAEAMIRSAERSIYLSLWPRELARLLPALEQVAERPLHRVLHTPAYLAQPPRGFSFWMDEIAGDEAKLTWSHKVLVVVDRREALIGGAEPRADNQTVWTTNPSLVDTATNHIILDITLLARARGIDPVGDVAPMMRPHLDGAASR